MLFRNGVICTNFFIANFVQSLAAKVLLKMVGIRQGYDKNPVIYFFD